VELIRKISDNWSGHSITDLTSQQSRRGSRSFDNNFQEEKEIIEPTGCNEIVNIMTNTIGPYL
jgi:hypothetical protein